MITLPSVFLHSEVLIVLPVLWKEQWSYVDEEVISALGNDYFELKLSLSSHKPTSDYETMMVF